MSSSNRSVSPQTVEASKISEGVGVWRDRIGKVLSFFKPHDSIQIAPESEASPSTSSSMPGRGNGILDGKNPFLAGVDEPLQNNFLLEKRRRMSIQAMRNKTGYIPRSSTLASHPGLYQTYAATLEVEQEGLNNHLERRLSTTYNGSLVKDTPGMDVDLREQSPLLPVSEAMEELTPPPAFDAESTTLQMENFSNNNSNYFNNSIVTGQAMVETEYAPLYTDEGGNLVRPPFINLDPKERYELLKLKRAMRERQHLESRLKYMVDPNETSSTNVSHNKVETSTQTHDPNYLEKSLHFVNLKRKLKSSSGLRNAKRRKNNRGYFVAEFYYDVNNDDELEHKKSVASKYDGYLGLVSKPLFKTSDKADGVTLKRNDLENVLKSNAKVRLSLDSDFVKEKESLADLVKIKEPALAPTSKISSNEKTGIPMSQPSAGFTFNINKSEIQNIVSQRKEADRETAEKVQELKLHQDDEEELPRKKRAAPSSSFNIGPSASSKPTLSSLPKLSFGNVSNSTPSTGSFPLSSGSLFGNTGAGKKVTSLSPGALFNPSTDSTTLEQPTLPKGLGLPKAAKDEAPSMEPEPKSSVLEQSQKRSREEDSHETSKPTETKPPPLSFGFNSAPKSSGEGTNTSLFGGTKETASTDIPKFSFGKSALPSVITSNTAGTSEDTSKPLFGFGSEKKDTTPSTPAFSFGGTSSKPELAKSTPEDKNQSNTNLPDKEPGLFGASIGSAKNTTAKPLFAFGNNNSIKPVGGLAFSFGNTSEKNEETTPKPSISFGSVNPNNGSSESPKPFTFRASATPEASSTKPVFAFGNSSANKDVNATSKPLFGLGSQANASTSTVASQSTTKENGVSFAFGDTTGKDAAQIFGASTTPSNNNNSTTTPAFAFGRPNASTTTNNNNVNINNNESASSNLVWGSGRATPTSGVGAGQPGPSGFSFGGSSASKGFGGQPQGGFNFGEPKPDGPQFGFSRETTPVGNGAGAFTSPAFGGAARGGMNPNRGGFGGVASGGPGFNFTGSISSKENTPDPTSIFGGMANNNSGGFGGGFNGGFDAGGQASTQPVISGRKIAHPRRRGAR